MIDQQPFSTMALPDLIEIIPPAAPPAGVIAIPGSKSITNRALILAALAEGQVTLEGALWSEDTQVMVECLRKLGFEIRVSPDPHEPANRSILVQGRGIEAVRGGTEDVPLELHVGNAGTAARFLAAFVCLGQGIFRLSGVARMHQRPQAALFRALRELGYRVDATGGGDTLPARIHGTGPQRGRCRVSIGQSSQFASALLLVAKQGGWTVEVEGENQDESPYVVMTSDMVRQFPGQGGVFRIEPDASSGSYFVAAARLFDQAGVSTNPVSGEVPGGKRGGSLANSVRVAFWPESGLQVDEQFPRVIAAGSVEISRSGDLGDSILTAMILAPFGRRGTRFTDLGRLRVQECERVQAMRTELAKCGARVEERGDTLEIWPGPLHGAEIETYDDHRIAMCFAILGLRVPGIRLKNPACVKKTFPNFFQKLAAPAPSGLNIELRDGAGCVLDPKDLIAI